MRSDLIHIGRRALRVEPAEGLAIVCDVALNLRKATVTGTYCDPDTATDSQCKILAISKAVISSPLMPDFVKRQECVATAHNLPN